MRVVAYDPTWPARFEAERGVLEEAIGDWVVAGIHHVGSTAVPGLAARPVIDIVVGVCELASSRGCFEPLAKIGSLYAPYRAGEMHWFVSPPPTRRTHRLHLVPHASRRYRDELAFCDYLRTHPDAAAEHAALKRRLASRFEHDREAYTDAKAAFIHVVVDRAKAKRSMT
jgi:GrpB-like predicted nucleotidyltransferase (UPF0157 family)